jgi:hypothetical protein
MRKVYTFAGLTFALALGLSLTTAAQTSSTESKKPHQISARLTPPEICIGTGLVNAWSGSVSN